MNMQEMKAKIEELSNNLASAQSDAKTHKETLDAAAAENAKLKLQIDDLNKSIGESEKAHASVVAELEKKAKEASEALLKANEAGKLLVEANANQCHLPVASDANAETVDHRKEYLKLMGTDHRKAAEYYSKHKEKLIGK